MWCIVDLEDAVAPDRKEYALRRHRRTPHRPASRTRPGPCPGQLTRGPLAEAEIATLAALPGLAALRLPKVDTVPDVVRVTRWARHGADGSDVPALYALLESALGIEHAFAIATAHPALRGIALGEADLRADWA